MKGRATTVRAVRTTVLAALALAAVMLSTGIAVAEREQDPRGSSAAGHEKLGNFDYGVCRGPDVRCYHNWGNFDPANGFRALLWARTAGPRPADLGPALGPGLDPPLTAANVVQNAMIELA